MARHLRHSSPNRVPVRRGGIAPAHALFRAPGMACLALLLAALATPASAVAPPPAPAGVDEDRVQGETLVRQGRFALSIPFLIEATKRDPMVPGIHVYLAFALRQVGRREEAGVHYRFALRLDPDNPWALAYYGVMLLEDGDRAAAQQKRDALARICPEGCPEREELDRAFAALP